MIERGVTSKAGKCGINMQASYPVVRAPESSVHGHYEKPPCADDEIEAIVQGMGHLCTPECKNGQCPSDVPADTAAHPKCVLRDASNGKNFCALVCSSTDDCPNGETCVNGGGMSICVDEDAHGLS